MANSYTQLYVHIVFVVKGREYIIPVEHKEEIKKYITGIVQKKGHKLIVINGVPDHFHLLVGMNPDESLSSLVKEIKRCSSIYINEKNLFGGHFEWQQGYGAFTNSRSQVDAVYKYIENQEEHHKLRTFREEYIDLLKKFGIDYDERYIFKDV